MEMTIKELEKMNLKQLRKVRKKIDDDFFYYLKLHNAVIADETTKISKIVDDLIFNKIAG